jgi:hypothetical protein
VPTERGAILTDVDSTAIVGIVVAGVVGPGLGYIAGWRSDMRRFWHDRQLKAADDLVALLDDIEVALDKLGEACAEMRSQSMQYWNTPEVVGPSLQAAEDVYQNARALIARLRMRPYADPELVKKAGAAAACMLEAIRIVRRAIVGQSTEQPLPSAVTATLGDVPAAVDRGYEGMRVYEAAAREAVARLLGAPASKRLGVVGPRTTLRADSTRQTEATREPTVRAG